MKRVLVAAALAFAATPALAVTVTEVVKETTVEAGNWASVCVGNIDLDRAVAAQYKYGTSEEWTDIAFEQDHVWIFTQRKAFNSDAMTLTIKFLSTEGDDATEITYDLEQNETVLRHRNCSNINNYRFMPNRDVEGSIDLYKL
jgi:hypothetical protein